MGCGVRADGVVGVVADRLHSGYGARFISAHGGHEGGGGFNRCSDDADSLAMAAVMDSREESLLAAIASLCLTSCVRAESGASSWLALLVMRVVFGIGLQ